MSEIQPEPNFKIFHLSAPAVKGSVAPNRVVGFDRIELQAIFDIYGRMVAEGVWRDYAMDFSPARAVFSIFRRNGEAPYLRIIKESKAIRRQGPYSVVGQTGLILKRGVELARVLAVLENKPKLVTF